MRGPFAFVTIVALVALASWQIYLGPGNISPPPPSSQAAHETAIKRILRIQEGEGLVDVTRKLAESGILDDAFHFRVLALFLGYEGKIQAGTYSFSSDMSTLEVLQRLRHGRTNVKIITVIEGWQLGEIAKAVEKAGIAPAQEFLKAAVAGPYQQRFSFLQGLDPSIPLEGYLFPATYLFPADATIQEVISTMLARMDEALTPQLREEIAKGGLTVHQALTIASIVERETALSHERPIIAQVFLKRWHLGMPLEADPTVQYALAQVPDNVERYGFWKAPLTLEDLRTDSPYNTYVVASLPPGPIASPSMDSILATIRPADTDYLYFVARKDGSHAFASSWEEHLANVALQGGE